MSKKGTQAQRYQGMVNRSQGKLFEERIDVALAYYDRLGVASVEKTPEPMRPIRSLSEGRFVAIFEKPAQPDYKGTLKGGRAVVFEAKHTTTGQMEQSRVTEAQAKRLEHHQELGALCFVVAGFGSEEVFRVPWGAGMPLLPGHRESKGLPCGELHQEKAGKVRRQDEPI